jgi:exopolyphosphatase/guanosine-5'-triphosphate,3'-diphosphate pyrophosphatase
LKLAAIDIGSNAVRLLIEEVFEEDGGFRTQKESFTRIPLRLGDDVFEFGAISHRKAVQLSKVMKAFWYLMDVHEITSSRACATSAMREASNAADVVDMVYRESGVKIDVIDGEEEADMIVSTFLNQKLDPLGDYLYIDVGGGSTEVTMIKNGLRVQSKSFPIGTVRMLQGKVSKKKWVKARKWVHELADGEPDDLIAVGTGGNINKIFKEIGKKPHETISSEEIEDVHAHLKSFTYAERVSKLGLRPDRADVILPAAEIYHNFMRFAGVKQMTVPRVGLSDGVVFRLFQEWEAQRR